ncbi:MAG: hypothetical protein ACYDAJ_10600 [Nitrosotalea sp.]
MSNRKFLFTIVIFIFSILTIHQSYAQNSTTMIPSNAIRTSNGGSITPLQTTNSSGGNLTIHVENGTDVSGKFLPPPVTPDHEQTDQFESPLKQFKSGVPADKINCKIGLQLILKAEDGSPACVKPDTTNILLERGWAKTSP